MSKKHTAQALDPRGILVQGFNRCGVVAQGSSVPSGKAGYAVGCIFAKIAGGVATALYINEGTIDSCTFNPLALPGVSLASLSITAAELNKFSAANSTLTTGAGVGITTGTGTIYKTSVLTIGNMIITKIYIDLTGLASISTDGDIIGVNGGGAAHIGRITAAQNGTIESLAMFCLETPAGGLADIDLFRGTVGTGVQDDAISTVTGNATTGAINITAKDTFKTASSVPAANDYLYLLAGAGSGAGTYTAGKLLIEMIGY